MARHTGDAALAEALQADELAHARGMAAVRQLLAERRRLQQLEAELRAQGLRVRAGPGNCGRQRQRRRGQRQRQEAASGVD